MTHLDAEIQKFSSIPESHYDPSIQKFIEKPDSYYLYVRGPKGQEKIVAQYWLWARIRMIFGRNTYRLKTLVPLLTERPGLYRGALNALQGKVRKYETKKGIEISVHRALFCDELSTLPEPSEMPLQAPTPLPRGRGTIPLKDMIPKEAPPFTTGATFYSYNAEGLEDQGWGSTWRSTQMCLSALLPGGVAPSIKTLFAKFGAKNVLAWLLTSKNREKTGKTFYTPQDKAHRILMSEAFASPFQRAEPFVAEMILHYFGCDSDLMLLNGKPKDAATPDDAFFKGTLNFETFRTRLLKHFKLPNPPPVMIDDGRGAVNIVSVQYNVLEKGTTTLWIADPRITPGMDFGRGLFSITLDNAGWTQEIALSEEDLKSKGYTKAEELQFLDRPWMVLFPKRLPYEIERQ